MCSLLLWLVNRVSVKLYAYCNDVCLERSKFVNGYLKKNLVSCSWLYDWSLCGSGEALKYLLYISVLLFFTYFLFSVDNSDVLNFLW